MKRFLRDAFFLLTWVVVAACLPSYSQSANSPSDFSQSFDMTTTQPGGSQSASATREMLPFNTAGSAGNQSNNTTPAVKPIQPSDNTPARLEQANNGDIGAASCNMSPVPSGQWNFGFSGGGATSFWSKGGYLPSTSTSSCDINITE